MTSEDAERFRRDAERIRQTVRLMIDPSTQPIQTQLKAIANTYEKLAYQIEQLFSTRP